MWSGATNYFSDPLSSVRRWPCTDHSCLSMMASNWIRTSTGTNRPASIEWSPSLCRRVETADQFLQDWMAMDTSPSSHSDALSNNRSTSHQTNIRVQVPWLSRWWTSLIQWTLQEDAPKSPKEPLLSSNTSLDQKLHQRERETSPLKPSFNLICKWCTQSGQCCRSVQLKKSKRKIDSCLVSFTIGGTQPMMKYGG